MSKFEKTLIAIVVFCFTLQFLPYFTLKYELFILSIWFLSISYLFGGFWLFNVNDKKYYVLPIVSGIAFAFPIFILPLLIRLQVSNFFYYFPILTFAIFLVLSIYIFKNRKHNKVTTTIKHIYLRSIVVLIVCSIFTYLSPPSNKLYRHVLISINKDESNLVSNLLMFDYIDECTDALDKGDCENAIYYAEMANITGKAWLDITDDQINKLDSNAVNSDGYKNDTESNIIRNNLQKISGTYIYLYKAYKCKAASQYQNYQFSKALENYQIAHKNLIVCDHISKYWDEEKSWSYSNMANCYEGLNEFHMADSFYVNAIENYKVVNEVEDYGLAKLYSNLAFLYNKANLPEKSNALFYYANSILDKEQASSENKADLVTNFIGITRNYLIQDSIASAMYWINKAQNISTEIGKDVCASTLYYGVCLYKMNKFNQADSVLKLSLQCFQKEENSDVQNIAECSLILGEVNIALAKYSEASNYLNTGIKITEKNYGVNSSKYASYLAIIAKLNKTLGEYNSSYLQYEQAIKILANSNETNSGLLAGIYSEFADINITLSDFNSAKLYSNKLMLDINTQAFLNTPSATGLLNNAAYIDYITGSYKTAESQYKKVISINNKFELRDNISSAVAFNGLGLIEITKRNYKRADTLLAQSLKLHKQIYTENNPLTAVVYLNYAKLNILENQLDNAQNNLNKALSINSKFFKSEHDIFADIYVALGDLANKKRQKTEATAYYTKALNIYKKKFNNQHWKVIDAQKKLKSFALPLPNDYIAK